MNFIAKITNKQTLNFGSPYNQARFRDWAAKNIGMEVKLIPSDIPTNEMRGYYFGAIVPAIAESSSQDYKSPEVLQEIHELLKTEFNGKFIKDFIKGGMKKISLSTTRLNKSGFSEYLNRITAWMSENQIPVPDSNLYREWHDTEAIDGVDFKDWLFEKGVNKDGERLK